MNRGDHRGTQRLQDIDLQACLSGDEAAWNHFVNATAGLIVAAVRQTCGRKGNRPEAMAVDDLVQDVFIRLVKDDFRLLRTYDASRAGLSTWLTLVARSTTIDRLRKKRLPSVPLESYDAPVQAESDSVDAASDAAALPLHLLSARQRLVLQLMFEEEKSVPEVASLLDVDEQTVRSTKHKALSRLRAHYQSSDVEEAENSRG